tara:strand:- start:1698 stop:1946 length:249 start_codon:yes stop_codon:yes gene_type:complete
MNNKTIYVGQIPEINKGYGISVFANTKNNCIKKLKKAFYEIRKNRKYSNLDEFYTFKGALDYFGGSVFQVDFDKTYNYNIGE